MMVSLSSRLLASTCLLLAFVSACLCREPDGSSIQQKLKLLCENQSELAINRISQIKALVEEYNTNPIPCPEFTIEALRNVNQLLEDNKHDACTLDAVNRIRNYHLAHVALPHEIDLVGHQGNKKDDSAVLPVALRDFFIGYGLVVSKTCKKNMIPTLMYSKNYLKQVGDPVESEGPLAKKLDEYYQLLGDMLKDGSKLDHLIKAPMDYDDLLLIRDVEEVVQERKSPGFTSNRLTMQVKSLPSAKVFKAICERRYKSVYQQLILPVLYLSNMGFNYQSDDLKRELDEMQANERVHLYYRMTFFCEALENIELVEDLADVERNQRAETTQTVRVLSPQEAEELKIRQEQLLLSRQVGHHDETDRLIESIERFVFQPDYSIQIDDEILDKSDSDLMRLVRSFDTNQSELDRVRSRFMGKLKQSVMGMLRSGLELVLGKFVEFTSDGSNATLTNDLSSLQVMKLLDQHLDENSDKQVSMVGRVKGYSRRLYFQAAKATRTNPIPKLRGTIDHAMLGTGFWVCLGVTVFILGIMALFSVFG